MLSQIKSLSQQHNQYILGLYRYLHSSPELSFKEFNTSKKIAHELETIGIPVYRVGEGTGVLGIIQGEKPGPTIGFRAELDALPIQETTGLDFASKNPGVMHACGHDVHMANLIGAAKVLWELRHNIHGSILLVFQPGEELLPGGALDIIRSDVFQKNKPDIMMGLHILPEMKTGEVGFRPGPYMASGDEIYLTVKGKGGHAALPHTLIDPVVIASNIVVGLQQIVSRKSPSTVPTVLSFGKFMADGATNVIPDEVHIEGTFRTMDEEWRADAHQTIRALAAGIAKASGGNCIVNIKQGYPSVFNNPGLTSEAQRLAKEYLGDKKVLSLPIRMTTDDFARYALEIPSVYFRIGVGSDENSSLHTSNLRINEHVFEQSVGLTAWIITQLLCNYQNIKNIQR
ncbi:MAG: M20 family metallopeptidase [Perlabentimonas sp.]